MSFNPRQTSKAKESYFHSKPLTKGNFTLDISELAKILVRKTLEN